VTREHSYNISLSGVPVDWSPRHRATDRIVQYLILRRSSLDGISFPHASVWVFDDIAFHHAKAAKEYAVEHGVELRFAPAYAHWFSPVEDDVSVFQCHFSAQGYVSGSFAFVTLACEKSLENLIITWLLFSSFSARAL